MDGASFWRKISQGEIEENCLPLQTGEKPIIEYEGGKVVSFKRYQHEIDGKTVYEIVATNVTERYRLTKELEQKLDELKAVNKRLVAYGDNVALLTKEKELLAAKIRIHDDMGKLLLATKRRLAEPLNETEANDLLLASGNRRIEKHSSAHKERQLASDKGRGKTCCRNRGFLRRKAESRYGKRKNTHRRNARMSDEHRFARKRKDDDGCGIRQKRQIHD